jgi:hypothetical protein
MGLRTTIKLQIASLITPGGDYAGGISEDFPELDIAWASGTSSNQADVMWYDSRSLNAGADETHDLTSMANGPTGAAAAFAEVRAILIKWASTNDGNGRLGHGATNGWTPLVVDATDLLAISPGETLVKINPVDGKMPVAGGSKTIKVTNTGAAAATYQMLIIGVSA